MNPHAGEWRPVAAHPSLGRATCQPRSLTNELGRFRGNGTGRGLINKLVLNTEAC
jgi:hypothetical protein